jgi:hypothetical protein
MSVADCDTEHSGMQRSGMTCNFDLTLFDGGSGGLAAAFHAAGPGGRGALLVPMR